MESPIVVTQYGRVRGMSVSPEVWGFLGMPYAAPPVGPRRWRPPERPSAWSGVREAANFGPDAIQPAGVRRTRAPGMSEDCLYLNVWAPKERREGGWPVLVWSCGGAFTTGGGAFAEEDPARLAAKGAVVVSFNIRLNIFGFFAHAALSAESPHGSSGNYGLHDQAAAFRWVRENIAAFNGDSRGITFFGQSAGATVGALLMTSPVETNLYDRAILQSPGAFSPLLSREAAEHHGAGLGSTVEEMRNIRAQELLGRAGRLPAVRPSLWLARPLRPIADGWLITSETPFSSESFRPVSTIIGLNEDEGRFFGPRMSITSVDAYKGFVGEIFGDRAEAALARYPVNSDADVPAMFSAVYGDRGFTYPVDDLARVFVAKGSEVYRYVYAYRHGRTQAPPTHSEEIGVLMDNLPHLETRDAEMAETMARYWIAFAETGRPSVAGLPEWPRYDLETERHLRLDAPPSTGARWRSEFVDFLRESLEGAHSGAPPTA